MKQVLIVDLDGYRMDITEVADNVTGVFPQWQPAPIPEGQESPEEPQQELTGYMVAIPVPEGLHKPRFDFAAWEAYNEPLQPQLDDKGEPVTDDDGNIVYLPRPHVALWVEGLTAEELYAIQNAPVTLSDVDVLGAQLVEKELQIFDLQFQLEFLGFQVVSNDLRLLELEGGVGA